MILSQKIAVGYNKRREYNALAFAIVVKAFHKNSTIFDYKNKDIHIKFNISRPSYNKYIKTLIRNGHAIIINGSFHVLNLSPDNKEDNYILLKRVSYRYKSVKDIASDINKKLFMLEAEKQMFVVDLKNRVVLSQNPKTMSDIKSGKSATKKLDKLGYGKVDNKLQASNEVNFSILGLIDKIGTSQYSLYYIINKMISSNEINRRTNIEKIGNVSEFASSSFLPCNCFVSKRGCIYQCKPNTYTINTSFRSALA